METVFSGKALHSNSSTLGESCKNMRIGKGYEWIVSSFPVKGCAAFRQPHLSAMTTWTFFIECIDHARDVNSEKGRILTRCTRLSLDLTRGVGGGGRFLQINCVYSGIQAVTRLLYTTYDAKWIPLLFDLHNKSTAHNFRYDVCLGKEKENTGVTSTDVSLYKLRQRHMSVLIPFQTSTDSFTLFGTTLHPTPALL